MSIRLDAADELLFRDALAGDSIPQADPITACGWFKLVVDRDDDSPIFERYGDTAGTVWQGVYVSPDGSGVRVQSSAGSPSATIPILIGQWYHIAYRRTAAIHDLFLNGFHVGQSTGVPSADVTASFAIGGNGLWACNGEFALWRIWEASLPASRIREEMFSTAPLTSNVWGDYRIANDSVTVDSSPNGRTLRTNGATSNGASEPLLPLLLVPKTRSTNENLPRGAADNWNEVQASVVLNNDFFGDIVATGTGLANVWNGSAWVAKPVKVWNGSAWVTKPLKRWSGSSWV